MNQDKRKNILITGASDGLGLRLAHLFAPECKNLLLCGKRAQSELDLPLPPGAHYLVADQSHAECAQVILQKIQQLGWKNIDNLILAAGTGQTGPAIDQSGVSIADTMRINLVAPIQIVHALANDLMAEQDTALACVSLIGSTAIKGAPDFATYAASKAGLAGFARSLASEWRGRVEIQIIHPGPIATGMHEKIGHDAGWIKRIFLNPDYAARKIKAKIESRQSVAVVGFKARVFDLIKSRFGAGVSAERIIL